jgi:hypothetical protein
LQYAVGNKAKNAFYNTGKTHRIPTNFLGGEPEMYLRVGCRGSRSAAEQPRLHKVAGDRKQRETGKEHGKKNTAPIGKPMRRSACCSALLERQDSRRETSILQFRNPRQKTNECF